MKSLLFIFSFGTIVAFAASVEPKIEEQHTYTLTTENGIEAVIRPDDKIEFPGDPKRAFKALWRLYQDKANCNCTGTFGGIQSLLRPQ